MAVDRHVLNIGRHVARSVKRLVKGSELGITSETIPLGNDEVSVTRHGRKQSHVVVLLLDCWPLRAGDEIQHRCIPLIHMDMGHWAGGAYCGIHDLKVVLFDVQPRGHVLYETLFLCWVRID